MEKIIIWQNGRDFQIYRFHRSFIFWLGEAKYLPSPLRKMCTREILKHQQFGKQATVHQLDPWLPCAQPHKQGDWGSWEGQRTWDNCQNPSLTSFATWKTIYQVKWNHSSLGIWLGFPHSHESKQSLREAPKLSTPRHTESTLFPMRHLSEPYSEQQGAPEAVQGQVAKEVLQHCRLQGKPQLLFQLDIKLSSSNDKCLGLFTTIKPHSEGLVNNIQRQKSKRILKSK